MAYYYLLSRGGLTRGDLRWGLAVGVAILSGRLYLELLPDPYTDGLLKEIAAARGLSDKNELLVALGKRSISRGEAIDLMIKEVGDEAFVTYQNKHEYSQPKQCQNLMKRYSKELESGNDRTAKVLLTKLKDYCGYKEDKKT